MNADFAALIWVDYCIIGLIGLSALVGLFRGLLRELFSLALWGVAIWLGLRYDHQVSSYLEQAVTLPSARIVMAFLAIFIGVLLLGGMLGFLLGKLVSSSGLNGTDRLAGLVFGIARGALIVCLLVLLAGLTPLPEDNWWKQSKLIPSFQSLALWLRDQIPPDFASQVKLPPAILKR
ncbi:MAG: CvpA family protein [Methylococcaceae bacterium]|nr:CvpA family protein [Methylococcaceae bacterium]